MFPPTQKTEALEANANLEKSLKCSLCLKYFTKPHTFGGCGHTFCYQCVIDTLEGPGIIKSQCPTCKAPGWKKDLIFNHAINNIVDHLTKWGAATEKRRAGLREKMRKRQQLQTILQQDLQGSADCSNAAHEVLTACNASPGKPAEEILPAHLQKLESGVEDVSPDRRPGRNVACTEIACRMQEKQGSEHFMKDTTSLEAFKPATPDNFTAAWVERMLALSTPNAALAQRLLQEISKLDEAIRLCDELPCTGGAVQQQLGTALQDTGNQLSERCTRHASKKLGKMQPGQALDGKCHHPPHSLAAAAPWQPASICLGAILDSEDPSGRTGCPQLLMAAAAASQHIAQTQPRCTHLDNGDVDQEQANVSGRKRHKRAAGRAASRLAEAAPSLAQQQGIQPLGFGNCAAGSRPGSSQGSLKEVGGVDGTHTAQRVLGAPAAAEAIKAGRELQHHPGAASGAVCQAGARVSDSDDDFQEQQQPPRRVRPLQRRDDAAKGAAAAMSVSQCAKGAPSLPKRKYEGVLSLEHTGAGQITKTRRGMAQKQRATQQMQQAEHMVALGQPPHHASSVAIGSHVRVLWEEGYFSGRVTKYRPATGEHFIEYLDGDRQWHWLDEEEWELLGPPPAGAPGQTLPAPPPAGCTRTNACTAPSTSLGKPEQGCGQGHADTSGEPPSCELGNAAGNPPGDRAQTAPHAPIPHDGAELGNTSSWGPHEQGPQKGARWCSEQGGSAAAGLAGEGGGPGGTGASVGSLPPTLGTQEVAGVLLGIAGGGPPPPCCPGNGSQPLTAAQSPLASPQQEVQGLRDPLGAGASQGKRPLGGPSVEGAGGCMLEGDGRWEPFKPQGPQAQHAQQGGPLLATTRHNERVAPGGGAAAPGSGGRSLKEFFSSTPGTAEGEGGAKGSELARSGLGRLARPAEQYGAPTRRVRGAVAGERQGQPKDKHPIPAWARPASQLRGGVRTSAPARQQESGVHSVVDLFVGAEAEQPEADAQGRQGGLPLVAAAQQGLHVQQPPPPAPSTKVFVLTSLGSRQQVNVSDCIRKLRGLGRADREDWVSARTTHVLIATDDHGLAQVRSMKYMMGVAQGCWVVSYAWLDACMEAGRWVPEHAFEAKGDKTGRGAPMKARLHRRGRGRGLFQGITAYVHCPSTINSQNGSDLARLLEAGGATLLEQLSPGVDLGTIKLFVPGTDDSAVRAAKELKIKAGAQAIHKWDWVFDSLSHWQPQPQKQKYLFK